MTAIKNAIRVRVCSRTQEAADIISVTLEAAEGVLPPIEPGAHIDVEVSPTFIRQYSLCQARDEKNIYRLGILLDPASRGGSVAAFERLQVDEELYISAPRNNFALRDCDGTTFLYAGGIGITPLISMAEKLHAQSRPFKLSYATRTRDKAAFLARLTQDRLGNGVSVYHDDGIGAPRFEVSDIPLFEASSRMYICGPSGFISAVSAAAVDLGWADSAVHIEKFQNKVSLDGDRFTVVAARSGVSVEVSDGETIAEKLLDAGVDVPLSCEEGICGACLTPVLEGRPDHRDTFQTEAEKAAGTHMTLCCSRAKTPVLVVDI